MDHLNYPDIQIKSSLEKYYEPISSQPFMSERIHNEDTGVENNEISLFAIDYERIKKSNFFNKLEEKKIYLDNTSEKEFRNRITKSLRVSQISRTIASQLGYSKMDIYAVGSSALLNDLGCPPFDTYGENILNSLCIDIGGFCVNAQNIRIATSVETMYSQFLGLNLTYRTLLGAVKSFKRFNPNDIKNNDSTNLTESFIYDEDYLTLDSFVKTHNITIRTLDAQIISVAEMIVDSAYHLNDSLKEGLLNVDEIIPSLTKYSNLDPMHLNTIDLLINNAKNKCSFEMKSSHSIDYPKALRKEMIYELNKLLISNINLVNVKDTPDTTHKTWDKELDLGAYKTICEAIKTTLDNIISTNVNTIEYNKKGARAIEKLFKVYANKPNYLPAEFRADTILTKYGIKPSLTKVNFQKRLAADYIANMLDEEVFDAYKNFYGSTSLENL